METLYMNRRLILNKEEHKKDILKASQRGVRIGGLIGVVVTLLAVVLYYLIFH